MYAGRIVEKGTLEEVFKSHAPPLHRRAFNSLPNIHRRHEDLVPIPGLMPDPTALPKGCAFAPRCSYVTAACLERQPYPRKVRRRIRCGARPTMILDS